MVESRITISNNADSLVLFAFSASRRRLRDRHVEGGAYQNFTDRAQTDWQHAYYGDNFERLVETKVRWDPSNHFRFGQSIPVSP
jgi:hypothetical protein